jgi:hypothetical protein
MLKSLKASMSISSWISNWCRARNEMAPIGPGSAIGARRGDAGFGEPHRQSVWQKCVESGLMGAAGSNPDPAA